MTKRKRRFLFYILIAAFLLLSPLLIFYSLGYTFDLNSVKVEKIGGIFIKSKTLRLHVFLDGVFVKETSFFSGGALLTSVGPGTHLLRLEKQGFNPWFKTVEVQPAVVTELRHIILTPNPVPVATSTPQEIVLLTASPDRNSPWQLKPDGKLVSVGASATGTPLALNVHSFNVLDNTLWWVDKNGFLARLEEDGQSITTLGRGGFYLDQKPVKISKSPSGETILLDSSGGLFLINEEGRIAPLEGGVSEVRFDSKGEKMLLSKEKSIEVYWLKDYAYQPFSKKGAREIIINLAADIKDAAWFYGDDMHVLFRTREGIYLTEVDGRGGRNTVELISGKTDELRTLPEIPDAIFFRKEKMWYKITL